MGLNCLVLDQDRVRCRALAFMVWTFGSYYLQFGWEGY